MNPNPNKFKLSQDHMGITNVIFMQIVIGTACELRDIDCCKAIISEYINLCKGKNPKSSENTGYTQPWADFVQAVLDNKIKDRICKNIFLDGTIIKDSPNNYDFMFDNDNFMNNFKKYENDIKQKYMKAIFTLRSEIDINHSDINVNNIKNDTDDDDDTTDDEIFPHKFKLSQDHMGIINVIFMNIIIGAAYKLQDIDCCKVIISEYKKLCKNSYLGKNSESSENNRGYTKPWADFVQAVLDNKIKDRICKKIFIDTQIIEDSPNNYDFMFDYDNFMKNYAKYENEIKKKSTKAIINLQSEIKNDVNDDNTDDEVLPPPKKKSKKSNKPKNPKNKLL